METHPPPAPWLDLPISLTESILERLPLPDYVTFAAVCPKWRSIQQNHRLLGGRHLSIPWLIPYALQQDEEEDPPQETLIPCYSPFERHRFRRLRLPLSLPNHLFCASSGGWILLHDDKHISEATNAAADTKKKRRRRTRMSRNRRRYSPPPPHLMFFALLNPVSGHHIHLPPIHLARPSYIAAMSPPPNPTVLVIIDRFDSHSTFPISLLFLFRSGDPDWTVLPCPEGVDIIKTTSCGGKFYCTSEDMSLVVVDPCSDPTLEYFEMDPSMLRAGPGHVITLESDGELLLVKPFMIIEGREVAIEDFQVFKADLLRKKWVRVESLGERALILGQHSSVSLLADDFGGRRNCIYSSEALIFLSFLARPTEWKVFDLGTERMAEWPLPDTLSEYDCSQINNYSWRWIVPSLENVCENVNDETVGGMAGISQLLLPMRL